MSAEVQVDLPKGVVKRIVKEKLAAAADSGKDVQINKDALLAFSESAKVWPSLLKAVARADALDCEV
jgi:DNA polymerase epsilon subunit 3